MKNFNEIIEDQNSLSNKYNQKMDGKSEKLADRKWFNKVLGIFQNNIQHFIYSVKVTNEKDLEPAIEKVEKAVREIPETKIPKPVDPRPEIKALQDAVKKLDLIVNVPETKIPDNKKELLSIEKAVKDIKIPEVKIPEQKEVKFDDVIKALKSVEKSVSSLGDSFIQKTQEKSSESITELSKQFSSLEKLLKQLVDKPELEIPGNTDVIDAVSSVTKAVKDIKFPVPTFNHQAIVDAINNIDLANIELDVDQINLNTDELEGLATDTNTKLDTLNSKDFATETTLASIKNDGIKKITDPVTIAKPAGTGGNGSVTLTLANTAYAIPTVAPSNPYKMTVQNNSSAIIYIGYQNTNANGLALQLLADAEIELGASQQIYAYSATAGVALTYSLKES